MGIGPGWLNFFLDLCRSGHLKRGDAILDIGASEFFCEQQPECLNEFLNFFSAPPYPPEELARMANRGFAGSFFRRAGFEYSAIDYADYPGILRMDLNKDQLPPEWHGKFRLVANSGTSEHILNQYNVFKIIHDAGQDGAIMYHGVPGWDYEHGVIGYTPKFFWALATANHYDIMKFWGWSDRNVSPMKPEFLRQIEFRTAPNAENIWLHIIMRKTKNGPFDGLNDPAFSPEVTTPQRD